jgi:hypothetical protein
MIPYLDVVTGAEPMFRQSNLSQQKGCFFLSELTKKVHELLG